jgi:hypothetical protein
MGTSPKVDRILFATDFLAAFQSDDRHGAYSKAEFLFNVQDDWGCGGNTMGFRLRQQQAGKFPAWSLEQSGGWR